ncbi:MAG: hypothetical protein R6V03_06645 [Kiritimatiellia bacterium]
MNQQITRDVPVIPRWGALQRQAFKAPVTIVRPWDPQRGWDGASAVPLILETLGDRVADCHAVGRSLVAVDGGTLRLRVEVQDEAPNAAPDAEPGGGAFWQQDLVEFRLLLSDDGEMLQLGLGASGAAWDSLGLLDDPAKLAVEPLDISGGWGFEVRLDLNAVGLPSPSAGRPLDLYTLLAPAITIDGARPLCAQSPAEQAFSQFDRFGIFRIIANPEATGPVVLESIDFQSQDLQAGENSAVLQLHNSSGTSIKGRMHIEHECGSGDAFNRTTPVSLDAGARQAVPVAVELERRAYTRVSFYMQDGMERYPLGSVSLRGMPGAGEAPFDASALTHPYLLGAPENVARIHHQRETYGPASMPGKGGNAKTKGQEKPLIPRLSAALGAAFNAWLDSGDLGGIDNVAALAREISDKGVRISTDEKDPEGFGHHLKVGMQYGTYALAYDGIVPHVNAETAMVLRDVGGNLLDIFIAHAEQRAWWCTTNANANTVNNANAGMLALALLGECPRAAEALQLARRWIWRLLDYCQGPDGGNTEGAQYWEYGTMYVLAFGTMLESVTGSDDGILSHPSIKKLTNMIRLGLCPDGGMHGMNDTVPVPVGTRMAYFAASRYGDELGLWYGDHAREWWRRELEKGRKLPNYNAAPWAELFRPDRPAARQAPPFPTAFMLESIQYCTLRSAPRYDCKWMAGLKGKRAPFTHHNQRDAGAICVHLRGERLLIDAGYNMPNPTDHCLPIIDGQGPDVPGDFTGRIEMCEDRGAYRVASCDSTRAYGGKAKRVRRVLVMWADGPVLWLDDIEATGPGEVLAHYQCGGAPALSDEKPEWTIPGQNAVMQVNLLGAAVGNLTQHPQRELTKWGYCFAECEMHPVTADYLANADNPLISVCQDATEGTHEPPKLRTVEGGCIVELADGHYARFCRQGDRWMVANAAIKQ